MFQVIVFAGKGQSSADTVQVKSFNKQEDAEAFIAENNVNKKYWVYSEMLQDGVVYETYRDYLFDM